MKELTRLAVVSTIIASAMVLSLASCLPDLPPYNLPSRLPIFKLDIDYTSYDPNCPPPPWLAVIWPCSKGDR